MFAVDHVLLSDDLLDAPFACDLGACLGGCCVQGEAGAPLEAAERAELEAALPAVQHLLTPAALEVIEREGVWEETAPGHFNTTCVDGGQCVFVTYDGPVALCALQGAYRRGEIPFEKPISCHLYPLRVQRYDDLDVVNYERISLCEGGERQGCRLGVELADFLEAPLTRLYGADWYTRFRQAVRERREALVHETG